jgi:hypothetical protein
MEYEGTDENRWEEGGPRRKIVQRADQRAGGEVEPDLFPGLPPGCIDELAITGSPSPARKSQVSGPSVALAVGPADQQNAVGIRRENQGDPSTRAIGVFDACRRPGGEPRRELWNPAQCR